MIASMTAFARTSTQQTWGHATWEIRSVNHRYLDLGFKLPEHFREWELHWRKLATQVVHRGKIECHLTFVPSHQTAPALAMNMPLVEQLLVNCEKMMAYPQVTPTLQAMELLRWPEVLMSTNPDLSPLQAPLTDLFTQALHSLVTARQQEGAQLKRLLQNKLTQVLDYVAIIKEKLPLCLAIQKQKLTQKLNEIQQNIDTQRLEQELVLYAQRIDIEEEVERLITHVEAVHLALDTHKGTGRRLDFLMQEMGREANTLAAKAGDVAITKAAIELKLLVEQMREQIQNVE